MNYFLEILRGILIGIANIIPGVSGGTIALSLGIYEKIIYAINNIKKDFKNSFKTLLPYAIGIVIGIAGLAFIIEYLLDKFPIPTFFAFIGLILGGLPSIYSRVKNEKIKITHVISFILLALVIIVPTIISSNASNAIVTLDFNIVTILLMLVLGVIAAVSMVVPGVSGSMILMMLGYYETIVQTLNVCIKSALHLELTAMFGTFPILVPFGIGVLLGIIIAAKTIEKLLNTYPNATMWGIIALVVTSPFAILYGRNYSDVSLTTILISIFTLALGIFVSYKFSKE